MFKQVFAKFFKHDTNQLSPTEQYNGQAQIYAIPTVSSNFQPKNMITSSSQDQIKSSSPATNFSKLDYYAKYDDNNTRQIYIAPHCIRYSNSTLDDTIYRIDDESLNDIAVEILESENMPPKLQIVYYDNNYFAINNSNLQIYKQLQLSGLITHVQADLISVEAIPLALREYLLQTPSHLLENYTNELTDQEYHEELNSNGSQCLNEDSNEFSTSSGVNESFGDSVEHDCNGHSEECSSGSYAPDIVYAEDVYDENNLYVDEIYEFGTCENCVESDDENNVNQNDEIDVLEPYHDLNDTSIDTNVKLDVYLKQKHSTEPKVDLDQVVRNVLQSEAENSKKFSNLDEPANLSDELALLKLDVNQKKLNAEHFKQSKNSNDVENKQFISKQASKPHTSKKLLKSDSHSPEIKNLLLNNEEDEE